MDVSRQVCSSVRDGHWLSQEVLWPWWQREIFPVAASISRI